MLLTRDLGTIFFVRYLDLPAPQVEHGVSADPAETIARAAGGVAPPEALAFGG